MNCWNFNLGAEGSRVRTNRIRALIAGSVLACLSTFAGLAVGSESIIGGGGKAASKASPVAGLTNHELAGQRIVASFSGTSIPKRVRRAVKAGRLGGIILFAENVPSRSTARRLTRQLQKIRRPQGLRRYPLPIMIDQEGGLVKRLAGAPRTSAAVMGRRGPAFSRKQGRLTGRNLKNAGINIDLAPVLDVARPGGAISDTDRAFGSTAKRVSATAIPFARGLRGSGVAATAKHFPGLGKISVNTDDAVQKVRISKAALRKVDEAPYRPFVRAGGDLVMVGTAIYPAFGPKPAAFEKKIVTGELRKRIGFDGVAVTDALETVAARDFGGSKRVAIAGARAGMDLFLFTRAGEARKGEDALAKRLRSGALDRSVFEDSVERILDLRAGFRR